MHVFQLEYSLKTCIIFLFVCLAHHTLVSLNIVFFISHKISVPFPYVLSWLIRCVFFQFSLIINWISIHISNNRWRKSKNSSKSPEKKESYVLSSFDFMKEIEHAFINTIVKLIIVHNYKRIQGKWESTTDIFISPTPCSCCF